MVRVGMHRQENEKWCQSKRGEVSDHRRICYSPQSVPFPERARVYHFPPPTFLTAYYKGGWFCQSAHFNRADADAPRRTASAYA